MNSHNTKPAHSIHKTPVVTDTAKDEAEIVGTSLIIDSDLTIADAGEAGCDPYNSTGQHVVIKRRKSLEE